MTSFRKMLFWKISLKFDTDEDFFKAVGLTAEEFSNILEGSAPLSFELANKMSEVLSIPSEEIGFYFYADDSIREAYLNKLEGLYE